MKSSDHRLFTLVLTALLLVGCNRQPTKTKEAVLAERLAERTARWESDMVKRCRKEVEDKAAALTDSIVIANAKLNRDTSIHGLIPNRPTRPDYQPPKDSVPVQPFLKNGKFN